MVFLPFVSLPITPPISIFHLGGKEQVEKDILLQEMNDGTQLIGLYLNTPRHHLMIVGFRTLPLYVLSIMYRLHIIKTCSGKITAN